MSLGARWPVTARYALLPAASVLLVTLILLALARWLAVDEMARRVSLRNEYRAAVLAAAVDDALRGSVREMRLLARSPLMTGAISPHKVRGELERLQAQSPSYVWIGLVDMEGNVLAGTRSWLEGRSIATRPVFLQSRASTWLGDVHPAVALAPADADQRTDPAGADRHRRAGARRRRQGGRRAGGPPRCGLDRQPA